MRTRTFVTWSLLPMLAVAIAAQTAAAQGRPIAEVRGHGTCYFEFDDPDGVLLDQISIDAWLDENGDVHGTAAWTSVYHGFGDTGPGSSGYPWYMNITDLMVSGNEAYVEAVVVSSPQVPDDEGESVFFLIRDNGSGAAAPPDEIGPFGPPFVPIAVGNFIVRSDGDTAVPPHEVLGHGVWTQIVGAGEDEAQYIDQVSINAWLDDSGDAHGSIVWGGVYHDVPADPNDPFYPPGPGNSGYTWFLDVVNLEVSGNEAGVLGIVVHSPQVPDDVGTFVLFEVTDNGTGGNDPPDVLSIFGDTMPIEGGNFTVR